MISRRNIRVKVLQALYISQTVEQNLNQEAEKYFNQSISSSRNSFVYFLCYLNEVANYARELAFQKANKYLPTTEDLNTSTKLSDNEILPALLNDLNLSKIKESIIKKYPINREVVKQLFTEFSQTDCYQKYIATNERNDTEDKNVLLELTDFIMANDAFNEQMEDCFVDWDSDDYWIYQLMKIFITKSVEINFASFCSAEKIEFGINLIRTVNEKSEILLQYISPKLKNWEVDRIADVDLIILKMAISEFLFFETIPPKVTINEYIDIAKDYSTQQSGHFINGVLDNIQKQLLTENKLQKVDFRMR